MSESDKFEYEMMGTIELAKEVRLLKQESDHYAAMKKAYKHAEESERTEYHRRWRNARSKYLDVKKILENRQMKMF
jgi:hypothetical protein